MMHINEFKICDADVIFFPSNDGKKMEKYRPSTSEKNVNAAP